ncbi:MAG: hypothetical protein LBI77_00520 [Puniceicoccales bacterium]|jgi:hypothetical protein|nr:hypothetical protein [Puniceicoccales bacterium]
MKKQFINHQLIISLGICSGFVAFVAIFGTLYFRQETFAHAENLKKIETQCNGLKSEMLALSARIAQMQTPHYLKQKLAPFPISQEQIFHIREWSDYKGSHMTRNALAMNISRQLFQ